MSNFLESSYTELNNLVAINADSIATYDLDVSNDATFYNLIMTGDLTANDIIQTGTNIINQSGSTGINLMSDIYFNNDSDITMYQTSSIK